jgi:hypothetical protein
MTWQVGMGKDSNTCSNAVSDDGHSNRAATHFAGLHMIRVAVHFSHFAFRGLPYNALSISMMWIWRCVDFLHLCLHHMLHLERRSPAPKLLVHGSNL